MNFGSIKNNKLRNSEIHKTNRPPLISYKEIAESLNFSKEALRRYISFSIEPFPKPIIKSNNTQIGLGNFYYDKKEVKKWLETYKTKSN